MPHRATSALATAELVSATLACCSWNTISRTQERMGACVVPQCRTCRGKRRVDRARERGGVTQREVSQHIQVYMQALPED